MPAERRGKRGLFGRYAAFYDALSADKDYAAECRYLARLFARHARRPVRTILSLGCGTGNHDLPLALRGFRVTGVDRSSGMLARYREKAVAAGLPLDVRRGDLRSARLGRRFDAVISMFAVIGYQVTDRDLARALATCAAHLRPGGVLVFDVWHGPAVLADPPGARTRTVKEGADRIVRHSRSRTDMARHVVSVTFRTERFSGGRRVESVVEEHPMRFFFRDEIEVVLARVGLEGVAFLPFGKTAGRPTERDWNLTVVARRGSARRRVPGSRP